MCIAISGKIGSGKTTVAEYIRDTYGYEIVSLASPLKKLASFKGEASITINGNAIIDSMFAREGERIAGKYIYQTMMERFVEELDSDQKPRVFLQSLGEAFRNIDEDCWVNYLLKRCTSGVHTYVCDDLRYTNEKRVLEAARWTTVRMDASPDVRIKRRHITDSIDKHPSEISLDDDVFDYYITNIGSINHLYYKIEDIMSRL